MYVAAALAEYGCADHINHKAGCIIHCCIICIMAMHLAGSMQVISAVHRAQALHACPLDSLLCSMGF